MTAQELMQTVELVNNHAAALTTSSVVLSKTSAELKTAFDEGMLIDDPNNFYELVHKFSVALTATVATIDKLITAAENVLDEE